MPSSRHRPVPGTDRGRLELVATLAVVLALSLLGAPASFAAGEEPAAGQPAADESAFAWGAEAELATRYVWRGMALSDGAVIQPSAWGSWNAVTLTAWANVSAGWGDDRGSSDELDLIASYELSLGDVTLEPYFIHYHLIDQPGSSDTGELGIKLALPLGSFELFTEHTVDVEDASGAYFGQLGVSYERELAAAWTATATATIGWGSSDFNEYYLGVPDSGFGLAMADFAITYKLSDALSVRAHIAASTMPDETLQDQVDDPDLVWGGVVVSFEP